MIRDLATMRIQFLTPLLAIASSLLFSGCAGTFKSNVNFNVTEPLRVAVLPFAQVTSDGKLVQTDENLLIDDVALVSSKLRESPARFVQETVQSELGKSSLDIITPGVVEGELLHNGFDVRGSKPVVVDLEKIFRTSPMELCTKLLSCDAVLYGKVTKWDRTYLAIQTVNTVGIELRLVSAKDGKVLFDSKAEDTESRGLTKGPTGFSDLVIEPIRGLDNEIITGLAREITAKMVQPLLVSNRPEYLESAPPAVLASAHDAFSGTVPGNSRLTVVALGTPRQVVSFSIGSSIEGVPMVERTPGHYYGLYYPLATDQFSKQPVTVTIRDQYGRSTMQTIGSGVVTLTKR